MPKITLFIINQNLGDKLIASGNIEGSFCMFKEALKYNPQKKEFLDRGSNWNLFIRRKLLWKKPIWSSLKSEPAGGLLLTRL